ncbi:MAG TPA: SCO family protein [Bryobacteraceae bacterium]|nr:SCO family protein [Bryobacteraceae bacterium]
MVSWSWIVSGLSIVALVGCSPGVGLPSYGVVPYFTLTDQTNHAFQSAKALSDKVWIADFMFTNCAGPCPRMSAQMRQVIDALREFPDVRYVSFTVDPARDTPEVLARYSQRYQAEPGVWFFLTGSQAELNRLARYVFLLGNIDGNLEHSTRFVLIDKKSRVRGYYLTSEEEAIPRLVGDVKKVLKEQF